MFSSMTHKKVEGGLPLHLLTYSNGSLKKPKGNNSIHPCVLCQKSYVWKYLLHSGASLTAKLIYIYIYIVLELSRNECHILWNYVKQYKIYEYATELGCSIQAEKYCLPNSLMQAPMCPQYLLLYMRWQTCFGYRNIFF